MLTLRGHPSVYAADIGMSEYKDEEHLLTASLTARILVTHNAADFVLLHDAWMRWSRKWRVHRPHSGILVLPNGTLIARIVELLCAFADSGRLPITNKLYVWDGMQWAKHTPSRRY